MSDIILATDHGGKASSLFSEGRGNASHIRSDAHFKMDARLTSFAVVKRLAGMTALRGVD
jgi:hypothetical protein